MLNITNKTTRAALILEIEGQRIDASRVAKTHAEAIAALGRQLDEALDKVRTEGERADHLAHKADVAETDVHNLLGAIRVMADSSRVVRIRARSVKSDNMATALPVRNTDKI